MGFNFDYACMMNFDDIFRRGGVAVVRFCVTGVILGIFKLIVYRITV